MNVIAQLTENYEEASKLWNNYRTRLQDFRGAVKNDLVSLEAGARKTTEAARKMQQAYGDVIAQMNSVEMVTAIQNAERLANALSTIAAVQAKHLTLEIGAQ